MSIHSLIFQEGPVLATWDIRSINRTVVYDGVNFLVKARGMRVQSIGSILRMRSDIRRSHKEEVSICAASLFLDQATCLFLLPYVSRTCFALDQTIDNSLCTRHVRRSDARQSRTTCEKCTLATTTDHSASTGQATNLSEDGSSSFSAPCQDGPNLETGAFACPARDAPPLAPRAFPSVLEAHIEGA